MFWIIVVICAWVGASIVLAPVLGLLLKGADQAARHLDPWPVARRGSTVFSPMRRAS